MGGKKKNLANRLAKMSEEERQRYLQHKADQEEEVRRRKEQLINSFLKNKIKREDAFARLNVAKLNENWHQLLRKTKCAEMKKEVTFMQEYIDRVLAFKNRAIQKLLAELQDAEEQHANNLQSHLIHIEETIDFGTRALGEMHKQFEKDVAARIDEISTERKTILQEASAQELHMRTVNNQFDVQSKAELRANHDYYFQIADGEIQQNAKEFREMRAAEEKQLTTLWLEIGRYIKEYVEKTGVRRAHLAELDALDAQHAIDISNNERQLRRGQAQLDKLERTFEQMQADSAGEIHRLDEHLAELKNAFHKQKTATLRCLNADDANVRFLAETSSAVINELQKRCDRGERMLQLSLICRKLATAEEIATRFRPFAPVEVPASSANDDRTPITAAVDRMDRFWQHYSRTLVSVMAMREEKAALQREHRQLQEAIGRSMEAHVEHVMDAELARNAQTAATNLFVVSSSATSHRTAR